MSHYFRKGKIGEKRLIPFTIHGHSFEFVTYTSLFSGRDVDAGTRILLEHLKIPEKGVVLDMGCGYGVIGIVVAKLNPSLKVYMVDVNPLAVKVARENAKLNGVEDRVVVLEGDRYEPVKNMVFQAIYSNPPFSAGKRVVEDIVLGAREHLDEKGFAQFVLARGRDYLVGKAREYYRHVEAINKKGYTILYVEP